jgi:murein DD-endopeptidase MepM/ murein hydrolase activator NlpD
MTNRVLLALSALLLMGATMRLRTVWHVDAAPAPVAYQPATERERWAVALLAAIGNTQPTEDVVNEVVVWSIAEDGGAGALRRNNPWNTTMPGFHDDGCHMADCVRRYPTPEDGIAATAATLAQGNFADVRAALLANDAVGFRAALWASPWAASHYSYGASWPDAEEETRGGRCLPTITGAIAASFADTNSPYWAGQYGGMHNGTDYAGQSGDPVFAPFDLIVDDVGYYGDSGRIGYYVQARFRDGYLFYAGHLGTVLVQVGQSVSACTQIGTIGEVFHTHIKIAAPGKPEPCEATGCDDFEQYYQEHE